MPEKQKNTKALVTAAIIVLVLAGVFFLLFNSWNSYKNRIYPGVRVGTLELGGLTIEEAANNIKVETDKINSAGLKFEYNKRKVSLPPLITSSADVNEEIFFLDYQASAEKAAAQGRPGLASFISHRLKHFLTSKNIDLVFTINDQAAINNLKIAFGPEESPAQNASFIKNSQGELEISPEKLGKIINYQQAIDEVKANLQNLDNPLIVLKTVADYPAIYQAELPQLKEEAEKINNRGRITLNYNDKKFTVASSEYAAWLKTEKDGNNLRLSFSEEKIKDFLLTKISPQIDKEASLPRFSMQNERLANWQTGQDGLKLNVEASALAIKKEFLEEENNDIKLVVDIIKAEIINPENDLNIKEIIGTGHSSYAGSPNNRRLNIKTGASKLNGLLIKPGEEFSLVKTLGEVEASTGYLPELVIKEGKTVPEYGGGLCQIGTTIFRAALSSGLPITERRNHSYRVSYYEPAGTDATIYLPKPDFRFLNDTGNYILIQARVLKNDLYFDIWGTKDGRVASTTYPTIYNIVKPPATKLIETSTLKPGEKKCTEKAHNGADAYFDYTVSYPATSSSESIVKKRFSSHYVPWQEVCLIGVAATSSASSTVTATSTATSTISQ